MNKSNIKVYSALSIASVFLVVGAVVVSCYLTTNRAFTYGNSLEQTSTINF